MSRWRSRRLMILCYHGISLSDEHEWNPGLYMPPAMLEARLALLRKRRYVVLTLDEGVRRLQAGTLPAKSVCITFDDGAHDFATAAVPLLEKYDMPATVYLTSFYVNHRYPVFDTALSYTLWKGRSSAVDLGPLVGSAAPLRVDNEAERAATLTALKVAASARSLDATGKDALLQQVAALLGVDTTAMRAMQMLYLMTADEVRALPDSISVELHTHRHRTPRRQQEFAAEMRENGEIIRQLRPRAPIPRHFCYPSGDYSASFVNWMRDMDMASATTCVPGLATQSDDPLLLPRFVDTTQQSTAAFAAWISGAADCLPNRGTHRLNPERA